MSSESHIIVLGNEKGGSGKTTTAIHLIVSLLKSGFKVGSIDIDARQRTLSRYLENRQKTAITKGLDLPMPANFLVTKARQPLLEDKEKEETENFLTALNQAKADTDFTVIDAPGSDTYLARLAHSYADTVITPMNDSFLDLDVIGVVESETLKVLRPSVYSEMVFQQKISRAGRDGKSIDWIVMRNRMSSTAAKNKKNIEKALAELSKRVAFRVAPGFNERVIYRELFLSGLTVLDVLDKKLGINISMSHIAARMEVRNLIRALNIEKLSDANLESRQDQTKAQSVRAVEAAGKQSGSPFVKTPEDDNLYANIAYQLGLIAQMQLEED